MSPFLVLSVVFQVCIFDHHWTRVFVGVLPDVRSPTPWARRENSVAVEAGVFQMAFNGPTAFVELFEEFC